MKNRYLLAFSVGILLLACSMVFSWILNLVFPLLQSEYTTPAFRPWNDPVMSLFFVYPVALGMLLTYTWFKTRKSWKNGFEFGACFGVLFSVPSFLVNFSSFTFSLLMVLSWTVMGFANIVIAGLALEKLEE